MRGWSLLTVRKTLEFDDWLCGLLLHGLGSFTSAKARDDDSGESAKAPYWDPHDPPAGFKLHLLS